MTVYEMVKDYILNGGLIFILLMTLVQIVPIKINPWTKIMRFIGKSLNKNLEDDINDLKKKVVSTEEKVDKLGAEFHEQTAYDERVRILRFGDEVSHGQNHSRDHFKQIMVDISNYDKYCKEHPDFVNNMTALTVERINEDYKERDKNNSFL